jgi:hypothetical protein
MSANPGPAETRETNSASTIEIKLDAVASLSAWMVDVGESRKHILDPKRSGFALTSKVPCRSIMRNAPGVEALAASISFCASSTDPATKATRLICSSGLSTNETSGGVKKFSEAKLAGAVAIKAVVRRMLEERRMEFMVL